MQRVLVLGFVAAFGTWLLVSLFAIASRLFADARRRRLAHAIGGDAPDQRGLEQLIRDAAPQRAAFRWRRIEALFALTRLRAESAHAALTTAIADTNADVVAAAAVNLRELGDRRAAAALISGLQMTPGPASRIAMHLDEFPIPIDDLLRPLLADANPRTRYWAASLLCRYPEAEGLVADLVELLADDDAPVRKAALTSLGTIAEADAVPIAVRALEDPAAFVRSTAARLIGLYGSEGGAEPYYPLAHPLAALLGDSTWEVRQAAKDALVQLGQATRHAVAAQLHSPDAFARDGAIEVLQELDYLQPAGAGG